MVIPLELEVFIHNEHICDFNLARIKLTEDKITWIKKMAKVVKRNDVAYIANYDCSPEYFDNDGDDPPEITPYDGSTEHDMVVVKKDSLYWKGVIKHTDVHFKTDTLYLKDLEDLIKFYKEEPIKNMPKFMNDEDYSKREIALHRMKGE